MRIGNTEIRPAGGGPGCLLMILFSILVAVWYTSAVWFFSKDGFEF